MEADALARPQPPPAGEPPAKKARPSLLAAMPPQPARGTARVSIVGGKLAGTPTKPAAALNAAPSPQPLEPRQFIVVGIGFSECKGWPEAKYRALRVRAFRLHAVRVHAAAGCSWLIMCCPVAQGAAVTLARHPANNFDRKAVGVHLHGRDGLRLGYVPRTELPQAHAEGWWGRKWVVAEVRGVHGLRLCTAD